MELAKIKVTTPNGKLYIIPATNKGYYLNLNKSIRDESKKYKIEDYKAEETAASDKTKKPAEDKLATKKA